MHTDFACLLYGKIKNRLKKGAVNKIIKEAVKIEKNFIIKALPCELIGMNADLMSTYIEFVADRLLTQLNYDKIWNSNNPFPFMERISIESKTNFFENKVSEYAFTKERYDPQTFSFTEDF
jgi:ribonucleotide reductase beta subunit family protein with ferritin-like domain